MHHTSHTQMLEASKLSFDKGDNSLLIKIFSDAVSNIEQTKFRSETRIEILTADDLLIGHAEDRDIDNEMEPEDDMER